MVDGIGLMGTILLIGIGLGLIQSFFVFKGGKRSWKIPISSVISILFLYYGLTVSYTIEIIERIIPFIPTEIVFKVALGIVFLAVMYAQAYLYGSDEKGLYINKSLAAAVALGFILITIFWEPFLMLVGL